MRHKSIVPWLVALACFGPFVFAWALYFSPWGVDWLPRLPGSRELLTTPVPLPAAWRDEGEPGEYRWSLIYAKMAACDSQCEEHLVRLLQVHLALNRNQEQVRRELWLVGAPPPLQSEGLGMRRLDEPDGAAVVAALGAESLGGNGRVYVADPFGNVILGYPADVDQKELLRDLKRLLNAAGKG